MAKRRQIPDLTFPSVQFGPSETPWDLQVLLYKGGSGAAKEKVDGMIANGELGEPRLDRLELVVALHAEIAGDLAAGGKRPTAENRVTYLRHMFEFADDTNLSLTAETITDTFCGWADSLYRRTRLKKKNRRGKKAGLSMRTAYAYGATVGGLLNRILERSSKIMELTQLRAVPQRKSPVGGQAEKQNLKDTFEFGHTLVDICDALDIKTVRSAEFPLEIGLRTGSKVIFSEGRSTKALGRQRNALINLRIEAELEMFIGQTGMNSTQALRLKLRHFAYVSFDDSYQVKERKDRRGGDVLFEIFKEYRPFFERYLAWRREFFPDTNALLFPFAGNAGTRLEQRYKSYRVRAFCKKANIPHVSPRTLRNTRVNWLLRETADSEATAEMVQSMEQTVVEVYHRPSLQRATVEAIRFWSRVDPALRTEAVAPGGCTGAPKESSSIPKDAPKPDCVKASGCLWCDDHRDVDSLDYVWALSSFKHLKLLELSRLRPLKSDNENTTPAGLVIARIDASLMWFEEQDEVKRGWVGESKARITEGDYHPDWRSEILSLEGTA